MKSRRDARDICAENVAHAKAQRDQLREDFPFAVQMVNELRAPSDDGLPPFRPKVLWMKEGDKEWKR